MPGAKMQTRFLIVVSLLALCVGCGGDGPIDVQPRFTVDGQPLKSASITFVRPAGEEGGRAAFGVTDENGVAKMTTFDPYDGILPGKYSVVVIKAPENAHTYQDVEIDAADPEALLKSSSMASMRQISRRRRVRTLLPEAYSDPGTTPLACDVDSNTEELTFDVKSR